MDATSPGNLPLPLNTVVFGGTAINNTVCGGGIPQVNYVGTAACAGNQVFGFQGWNGGSPLVDQRRPFSANPADWYHRISDSDVERIAKRVAELLRGEKP